MLDYLIQWASDPSNSNFVRTWTALIGIPGAIWGSYLFWRWSRGRGIDKAVDEIYGQGQRIYEQNRELHNALQNVLTKLEVAKQTSPTEKVVLSSQQFEQIEGGIKKAKNIYDELENEMQLRLARYPSNSTAPNKASKEVSKTSLADRIRSLRLAAEKIKRRD